MALIALPGVYPYTTFSHTLPFPGVPYEHGLRHIHSPEHACTTHKLCLPEFRMLNVSAPGTLKIGVQILNTSEPVRSLHINSVRFNCTVGAGRPLNVHMYSNRRDTSNILVFRSGRALLRLSLTVTPRKNFRGHDLHVDATALQARPRRWMVLPLVTAVTYMEDRLRWAYDFPEDPNLRLYRRNVLFREA